MGWAARAHGVACTIVVPYGNSLEKNAAMRALGVTLVEHGDEFQDAREHAAALAAQRGAHRVPSFHKDLVSGVATYWWEFFKAMPHMNVAYVPIGMGSGAAAAIQAKLALGHRAKIVGVVSAHHQLCRFPCRRPGAGRTRHHAAGGRHGLPHGGPGCAERTGPAPGPHRARD